MVLIIAASDQLAPLEHALEFSCRNVDLTAIRTKPTHAWVHSVERDAVKEIWQITNFHSSHR